MFPLNQNIMIVILHLMEFKIFDHTSLCFGDAEMTFF